MKDKSTLILVIVLAVIALILVLDFLTSALFIKTLTDFRVVVSEANRESTEAKLENAQMKEELIKNRSHINDVVRMNNELKFQFDHAANALREKDRELEKKKAELLRLRVDLVDALAACPKPETNKGR
ncbi:MAG: hypothetical protein NTZ92_07505 [Candidatus Omnitrophica bacterium]|nr:hypothetical protein [Candidatus Omnitrophota bacterium]